MSNDLDARIKVGADTRDAEAGIDRVNEKVTSMGDVASKAGAKASTALDGMGRSSEEAATKFNRSESAMSSAMRRAVEQMEIAMRQGKSLADAFQFKAEIRGFDVSKFEPMLERMRQLESQISVVKAAEEDLAAQNAFAKKHQQAAELNKAAQYTSWWAAELKKAEAAETELAAQNAFAKKHQQATELAKASQYASWWAAELDKVEAAERKLASENAFISSLKAQSDAIGKTRADLLELQAAQMGVSSQAAPFIAKMREAETGMAGTGMSAKAMSAAMRGVPAQISDIVVSLQGGMPVMTVFMQQGFQLRDMFGGFGPAAKALGSTLLGLVNPYTVAAAGVAALGATMLHTESTLRTHMSLMNQLEATGRAGFLNADAVKQLKNDMAELPGISRSMASAIISDLVQVRTLGGEALQKIALMSADFAAATGQDAAGAAKELAKAMEQPDKAARALDEAFNFLTVQQLIAIDAMVEAGDKAGAQKLLLDALGQSLSGTAERQTEMQKASKELSTAWDDLMQSMSPSVETMHAVSSGLAGVARGINSITEAIPRANAEITKWLPGMQAMMGPLGMWARIKGLKAIEAEASAAATSAAAATAVAVGGGAGRGSVNPPLIGTTGAKSDADKDLSELLDSTKAFKAKKDAIEELNKTLGRLQGQQQRLRDEGRGDSKEAEELQGRINGVNEKIKSQSKTRSDGSKKEQTAYAELAASIKAKIDVNKAEIENSSKLNEAQKAEIKLNADLEDEKIALTAAHKADLRERIEIWKQQEKDKEQAKQNVAMYQQQLDIEKQVTEDYLKRAKALESARQAMDAYEKSAQEDHERLQLEAGLIGMSNQARAVALAQYDAELELKRRLAAIDQLETPNGESDREALRVRERAVYGVKLANAQTKAYNDEWSKAYDQASQALTDSLMRGGKNAGEYLKDYFRTLVLQPVIKAIVQPVAGGIADGVTSVLGLGGGGGSGGGASSALSTASNASSLLSMTGAVGAGVKAGMQGWAGTLGLSSTGTTLGGSLSAGWTALGAGNIAGGLGTLLGVAAPVLGAVALLSQMDFGSRGANHTGGAYSTSTTDRNSAAAMALGSDAWGNALGDITSRANTALDTQLGKTVDALSGVYTSLAKYAGDSAKQIDIAAAFAVNPSHSDEDNYAYFQLRDKISGELLSTYKARDGVLGTDPEKAYATAMGKLGSELVGQLMKADIPGWMRSIFSGLGEDITLDGLNQAIQAIAVVDAAFKGWADTLTGFANLSAEAQSSLISVSGGIDGLAGNVNAFYAGFYSESERMATLQRQVLEQLAGLDVSVDTSTAEAAKESFRATVEGALAAGNAELAAKLLALSGNFATAADYAAKAAEESVQAASKAMEGLLSDRRQLEAELLQAQGNATGYAAAMRAIAVEGFGPAELAAYDYNEALRAQITEAERAATATQDAASALASLRQQATGIVQSQQQGLDSLIAGLQRKAEQAAGGYVGNLWLSGSEFTQFAGFADQLDGATDALAQLQALGLGDELGGYVDQIGTIVQNTKEALAGALSSQRLLSGDATGALAAAISASMPQYADYTSNSGQFDAGAYNAASTTQRAKVASGLIGDASANALSIPGIAGVLGSLVGEIATYSREVVLRDLRAQGSESLGPMVSGLLTGVYEHLADAAQAQMISGPGLGGIMSARMQYGSASASGYVPGYGHVVGEDLQELAKALSSVRGELAAGKITAAEADRALQYLNTTFGDLVPLLSDVAGQTARAAAAAEGLRGAGMAGVEYYFSSLASVVGQLDAAAAAANSPLAQTTNVIGLLDSTATAFGQSASAALQGAQAAIDGFRSAASLAGQDGNWDAVWGYSNRAADAQLALNGMLGADSRVSRAQMIADAAAMASGIMTTASAAKAAEELAGKLVLGEGQSMRDLSLLVSGVGQYDNAGFYDAFARISDALGAGTISSEQYKTLFDYALGVYQGVDDQAKATASAFERLRDSMKSFADGLLIGDKTTLSPEATLAEMQRQYAEAFKLAAGGDTDAASTFQSLANSILDQSLYSTRAEYNAAFGRTYGDARALEQLAVLRSQNPNAGVEKQLAELQKRVDGLERILAQIAKNTADTSRGVEGLGIPS